LATYLHYNSKEMHRNFIIIDEESHIHKKRGLPFDLSIFVEVSVENILFRTTNLNEAKKRFNRDFKSIYLFGRKNNNNK